MQEGAPFAASGSIDSGDFDQEDDRTLSFDRFDPVAGHAAGATLGYHLSCDVNGSFECTGQGGGWSANTVVVIEWNEGKLNREDGDGDGDGGDTGGSDAFDISASLSGTTTAEDLAPFTDEGQTDVLLKHVVNANGGPGAFDAAYDFDSAMTLTYEYEVASGGDDGGSGGGTGGGGHAGGGGGGDGGTPPAPIPLPAGLPLLLGGLGALGLARRFRCG